MSLRIIKAILGATQLDNYLENWNNIDSLEKGHKEFIKNNKLISKIQQRFTSEMHNVFTLENNKIALSSNDGERIQSIDSIETYAYGSSKDLLSKKEEI